MNEPVVIERGKPAPERTPKTRRLTEEMKAAVLALDGDEFLLCAAPLWQCIRVWAWRKGIRIITESVGDGNFRIWRANGESTPQ